MHPAAAGGSCLQPRLSLGSFGLGGEWLSSPPSSHQGSSALSIRVRAVPALLLSGAVALSWPPGSTLTRAPFCPGAGLAAPPSRHRALNLQAALLWRHTFLPAQCPAWTHNAALYSLTWHSLCVCACVSMCMRARVHVFVRVPLSVYEKLALCSLTFWLVCLLGPS